MNKVNPKHYETYTVKVQPWDICERFPFNLGCCLKYLFRVGKKEGENPLDDLMKAKAYLDRHILNGKEFKADIPECMLPAVTNTCTSIIILQNGESINIFSTFFTGHYVNFTAKSCEVPYLLR